MEADRVFIDVKTCKMNLSEVLIEIKRLQAENPDYDIFLDGDAHAIVGRRKL